MDFYDVHPQCRQDLGGLYRVCQMIAREIQDYMCTEIESIRTDHLDSIKKFGQGMSAADCKQRVIIYCMQSQFQSDGDSVSAAYPVKYIEITGSNTVGSGGSGNLHNIFCLCCFQQILPEVFQGKVGIRVILKIRDKLYMS